MTPDNKNLQSLFEQARQEAPQISFEETAKAFGENLLSQSTLGASLLGKGSTLLKFFIPGLILLTVTGYFVLTPERTADVSQMNRLAPKSIFIEQPMETFSWANTIPSVPSEEVVLSANETSSRIYLPSREKEKEETFLQETTPQVADVLTALKADELEQGEDHLMAAKVQESNLQFLDTIPPMEADTLPASPIPSKVAPASSEEKNDGEWVTFTIDQNSSPEDLLFICRKANRAGLNYSYTTDLKKKQLAEFNAYFQIKGSDQFTAVEVAVPANTPFEATFGWLANAEGKAIDLTDPVVIRNADPKHRLKENIKVALKTIYEQDGIEALQAAYAEQVGSLDKKVEAHWVLNVLGYEYLADEDYPKALEVLDLNTRLYTREANVWDSLGEAYYLSGNKQKARVAFEQALSIKPKYWPSQNWIRRLDAEQ
ncbi:MAG: tetratricopeptide repeat protein [Bacteroidota bacterium]